MKIYFATQIIINDGQDKSLTIKEAKNRLLSYYIIQNVEREIYPIYQDWNVF